ncbi:MAG: GTPase Era [Thermoproteota archaeon]|nr:MAG: GTPase Era [Candidatus Korarchaeota archaeon]
MGEEEKISAEGTLFPLEEDFSGFKSGFVAILGRPNVGKSTLLNNLLGTKVASTTPKPQTTRTRILGVLHGKGYQIAFIDTPGIHDPINKLGEYLVRNAMRSLRDSDLNLFLVEAPAGFTDEDSAALQQIYEKSSAPLVLVINKIDLAPDYDEDAIVSAASQIQKPERVVSISAAKRINLDELVDTIVELLPEGPPFYDSDFITDTSYEEIVAEIIREKLIMSVYQEIPYQSAVVVEKIGPKEDNPDILHIQADIIVARPGQKVIVIGKGGSTLKKIGTLAREELEQFFGQKVFLELWVKVRENWYKSDRAIREFGYNR